MGALVASISRRVFAVDWCPPEEFSNFFCWPANRESSARRGSGILERLDVFKQLWNTRSDGADSERWMHRPMQMRLSIDQQ